MENEVQVVNIEDYAMSAGDIQRQVNIIQEVMRQVMKPSEHYGTIPGCGNKPTLLKPGAEKLSVTFRLAPSYKISKTELPNGHREYEIICTLTHIASGMVVGQGVGSCSTMEGKYRFRKAGQKCPSCGKEDTIIKGKKEYGGGWLCFNKKGGCGAKFSDGDPEIENQNMGRVEHDNPPDYFNTVLKMGKKRAHVDAVLTATGASDIFTQDIEDMPEVIPQADSGHEPPPQRSQKNKTPREMMFAALKGAGLSREEMAGFADFIKGASDNDTLSQDAMKDVANRTDDYIREWREAMGDINETANNDDVPF